MASPRKNVFSSSAGNKASAAARWLLPWVTLFVPGCAVTHSEGRLLRALGHQGSLPTAKYIINLGVMPDGAFAGHPSPRTPLTPHNLVPDNDCD